MCQKRGTTEQYNCGDQSTVQFSYDSNVFKLTYTASIRLKLIFHLYFE